MLDEAAEVDSNQDDILEGSEPDDSPEGISVLEPEEGEIKTLPFVPPSTQDTKPLAILETSERTEINAQRQLIRDQERALVMLRSGHNELWRSLMVKYDLPDSINYIEEGGVVLSPGVQNG